MTTLPERLLALISASEEAFDFERDADHPEYLCVFLDVRPPAFQALILEAAKALQAAHPDASEVQCGDGCTGAGK